EVVVRERVAVAAALRADMDHAEHLGPRLPLLEARGGDREEGLSRASSHRPKVRDRRGDVTGWPPCADFSRTNAPSLPRSAFLAGRRALHRRRRSPRLRPVRRSGAAEAAALLRRGVVGGVATARAALLPAAGHRVHRRPRAALGFGLRSPALLVAFL